MFYQEIVWKDGRFCSGAVGEGDADRNMSLANPLFVTPDPLAMVALGRLP
jgi:hypothetical protein